MGGAIGILTLQAGYNTAVVVVGTALLGMAGGVIGVFALLRKRALISDAISHATLPGVAVGFLVAVALGGSGRSLPVLLAGAAVTGALGVLAVQWIRDNTRLPEDAAIGTVLSVFFGLGVVLLSHIQTLSTGGQAGLDSFLLGQTAALSLGEANLIAGAAAVVVVVTLLFLKEFGVVCFDPDFAEVQGWSVTRLDLLMMALLLAVVAIGLKTVGLVLIIALLIIPPVAARFWTERLGRMVAIAGLFGAVSGWLGASASAVFHGLPAGAVIVLTAAALFGLSLLFAPARGLIAAAVRQVRFRLRVAERQGLMALAEGRRVPDRLGLLALRRAGLIDRTGALTERGRAAAAEAVREQALWERWLHDDPAEALARLDRAAGRIEEVLPADQVAELERKLAPAPAPTAAPAPAAGERERPA